jgi:pSer/pThr/pTyr-binding forkhead associated (FHA) protein
MAANLVFLSRSGDQKIFPLPSTVTVIGRRRNCDLRIPLDSISKRHCQISVEGDSLKVRDLGSRNGTFLNGKRIEEETAQAGDFIQVGPVLFALQIDGLPASIVAPSAAAGKKAGKSAKAKPKAEATEELADLEGSGSFAGIDLSDGSLEDLDKI